MTREEAITILSYYDMGFYDINGFPILAHKLAEACDMAIDALSADAILHESCEDCPLYDHERHSCPRFNKVIPRTIVDAVQVVRCKDCKHRYYADNRIPYERDWVCDWWRKDGCDEKGFCPYGERKGGEDE